MVVLQGNIGEVSSIFVPLSLPHTLLSVILFHIYIPYTLVPCEILISTINIWILESQIITRQWTERDSRSSEFSRSIRQKAVRSADLGRLVSGTLAQWQSCCLTAPETRVGSWLNGADSMEFVHSPCDHMSFLSSAPVSPTLQRHAGL